MVRRRRAVAVVGLVVLAVAAVNAVDAVSHSIGTTTVPEVPATVGTPPLRSPFPVGSLSFTVTEPATPSAAARSLTTYVRYPAVAGTGGPQTPATPYRGSGPFPLVVFSGGYAVSPETYSILLDAWAAAGYVVADPDYPFTTPTSAGGLDESDIVNHPGDLSAVITALLNANSRTGSKAAAGPARILVGTIQPAEIAAIGHSDGGDVTIAATADPCCRDPRIGAAVVLSGAENIVFGNTFFATLPANSLRALPLLVVQGTDDSVNPEGCSVQLYDQAPPPKYYLSMVGQSHQGPYLQAGTALAIVQGVTTDFLNGTLKGSGTALASMATAGNVPGSSILFAGTPTGLPGGTCPAAPGN